MQLSLRIALIIIMLIYLFCIAKSVKRKNMRIGYLIFWSVIGMLLIIALIVPNMVDNISKLIGFEIPINMLLSGAVFIILYLIYNLMTLISKNEKKITLLIQEISILKKRVEELEKKEDDNK